MQQAARRVVFALLLLLCFDAHFHGVQGAQHLASSTNAQSAWLKLHSGLKEWVGSETTDRVKQIMQQNMSNGIKFERLGRMMLGLVDELKNRADSDSSAVSFLQDDDMNYQGRGGEGLMTEVDSMVTTGMLLTFASIFFLPLAVEVASAVRLSCLADFKGLPKELDRNKFLVFNLEFPASDPPPVITRGMYVKLSELAGEVKLSHALKPEDANAVVVLGIDSDRVGESHFKPGDIIRLVNCESAVKPSFGEDAKSVTDMGPFNSYVNEFRAHQFRMATVLFTTIRACTRIPPAGQATGFLTLIQCDKSKTPDPQIKSLDKVIRLMYTSKSKSTWHFPHQCEGIEELQIGGVTLKPKFERFQLLADVPDKTIRKFHTFTLGTAGEKFYTYIPNNVNLAGRVKAVYQINCKDVLIPSPSFEDAIKATFNRDYKPEDTPILLGTVELCNSVPCEEPTALLEVESTTQFDTGMGPNLVRFFPGAVFTLLCVFEVSLLGRRFRDRGMLFPFIFKYLIYPIVTFFALALPPALAFMNFDNPSELAQVALWFVLASTFALGISFAIGMGMGSKKTKRTSRPLHYHRMIMMFVMFIASFLPAYGYLKGRGDVSNQSLQELRVMKLPMTWVSSVMSLMAFFFQVSSFIPEAKGLPQVAFLSQTTYEATIAFASFVESFFGFWNYSRDLYANGAVCAAKELNDNLVKFGVAYDLKCDTNHDGPVPSGQGCVIECGNGFRTTAQCYDYGLIAGAWSFIYDSEWDALHAACTSTQHCAGRAGYTCSTQRGDTAITTTDQFPINTVCINTAGTATSRCILEVTSSTSSGAVVYTTTARWLDS